MCIVERLCSIRLSLSQTSVDYNNTCWYCSTTMQHHLLLDHLGKGCHECTSMLKQLRLGGCVACELLFVMRLELGDLGALLLNRIQCLYGALVSELQSRKRMEASYSDRGVPLRVAAVQQPSRWQAPPWQRSYPANSAS